MSLSAACSRYLIPGIPLRRLARFWLNTSSRVRACDNHRSLNGEINMHFSRRGLLLETRISTGTIWEAPRSAIYLRSRRSVTAKRDYAVVHTESISISHESRDLHRQIRVEETPIAL